MRFVLVLLSSLILLACSSSAHAVSKQKGESVQGFDGRYFYAEGVGEFSGFIEEKTGELLLPPVHYEGAYRIGFDLKTGKKIDPDVAFAFVFPNGIPATPLTPPTSRVERLDLRPNTDDHGSDPVVFGLVAHPLIL